MDERDLFALLMAAIGDGRVSVAFDFKRLNHIDSPICVEADKNRWLYGILLAAGAAGFGIGWRYGAGAAAVGLALYFAVGRRWVERRMLARFHERVTKDIAAFKKLWRLRGVTLALANRPALCRSPDGDWRRFVLDHLTAKDRAGHADPS